MPEAYIKLSIAALLPVICAIILFLLDKHTKFGRLNYVLKQIIFGLVFGGLAVLGTEWGIPVNGAVANCRDGAVLIGGLMFGAPAGIIAGIIGGVERWIAVAWGVGSFTRVACSVSTIIAGFYAAALRKWMFENKKPGWFISLCTGVVMEVFHLTMVFITNMNTPEKAMEVVKVCTGPLVAANSIAVMLTAIVLALLSGEPLIKKKSGIRISQTIQKRMLATVVVAFVATSVFVFQLQNQIAEAQVENLLSMALDDITADIDDTTNENLLSLTRKIAAELETSDLNTLADKYDVADISIVDKNGIIVDSSAESFIGFNMASGEQSAEFLALLGDTKEFVQKYRPITNDANLLRKYAGVKTETGFLQVGYDANRFQRNIDESVVGITKNRHVGETGYILILDETYSVISAPKGLSPATLQENFRTSGIGKPNTTFSMNLGGVPCFARYRTTEGYYVVSVLPCDEAFRMRNIAVFVNTYMEILVFAALFALIYLLIKRVVVNQIKDINSSLSKIANGDLKETVNVRSNEEFASLSDDINSTVDTLKRYIDEASARIDKELEFAKNIQASALPNVFPAFPKRKEFEIYASMNPAKEVGGDFYDFYMTNQDTLHFLVADVSGKGIPAAMFMMRAKTELKTLTEAELPLCDVFTRGNNALCEGNDAGMFVTAWQGSVDLEEGVLRYANAGHNPPLVRHTDGQFEFLRTRAGFILAGMENVNYKTQELRLVPGDTVFLYTDGVTEATNADNKLYGEERLQTALNSREFDDMQELCDFIKTDVDAFVGDAPQFDDITMVAFRFLGAPAIPTIHFDEAKVEDINDVTAFVEAELEKLNCPMKTVIQINVAIDELFSNIVHHGYPDHKGPVTVKVVKKDTPHHAVCVRFEDEGIPYNPLQKEDPDVSLTADERQPGGLGIFMVKKTMDDLKYKYENGKNIMTIIKNLED
ncbi:MAG: SpoIIE family protein phosphatase [Clostridia bacterium]|nr:SpoIIE family protein phosphatase [Clostridia bacterium]